MARFSTCMASLARTKLWTKAAAARRITGVGTGCPGCVFCGTKGMSGGV